MMRSVGIKRDEIFLLYARRKRKNMMGGKLIKACCHPSVSFLSPQVGINFGQLTFDELMSRCSYALAILSSLIFSFFICLKLSRDKKENYEMIS